MAGKVEREKRKRKQLSCNTDFQGSFMAVPDLRSNWQQEDPETNAGHQFLSQVLQLLGLLRPMGYSMASKVNQVGQSEPAWEQLGEVQVGKMRSGLYNHNNS